jgi:hypothetical protein
VRKAWVDPRKQLTGASRKSSKRKSDTPANTTGAGDSAGETTSGSGGEPPAAVDAKDESKP